MLEKLLSAENITEWGICSFADTFPLLECKAKSRIPKDAKSVIVALFPYLLEEYENRNVSKYAVVPDYHKVCTEKLDRVCEKLKRLYPENTFVCFADNSPIRETVAATLAGVGIIGKNGLLINKTYGSYVFIAEIVTDLELAPSVPCTESCLECDLCVKSCPSGAIKDGRIEETKCLSYITQKKGTLNCEEQELVKKGGIIWGCDICSDVCPMNKNARTTNLKEFQTDTVFNVNYPENNREIKERAFGFRGAEVIRRNFNLLNQEGNR